MWYIVSCWILLNHVLHHNFLSSMGKSECVHARVALDVFKCPKLQVGLSIIDATCLDHVRKLQVVLNYKLFYRDLPLVGITYVTSNSIKKSTKFSNSGMNHS